MRLGGGGVPEYQFLYVAGAGCAYAAGGRGTQAYRGGSIAVPALYTLCSRLVHALASICSICPVAMSDSG